MSYTPKNQDDPIDSVDSPDSNDNEKIKCSVCHILLDSFGSFQSHTMTPEHALKIMKQSSTSNVSSNSNGAIINDDFNSTVCKVNSEHEDSILPELNVNKSLGLTYANCQLCSKMFSGPEPYNQHLESQAHKKKVAQQNPEIVGGNLMLKCEPCSKRFSGAVPYTQHMQSETHKRKLQNMQFLKKYLSEVDSTQVSVAEEKSDEIKEWFCYTCNVQCSGFIPYQSHVQGSIHFKNERRAKIQTTFGVKNSDMTSVMEVNNLSKDKMSENMPQLINGYQKYNEGAQNDYVLPEKIHALKVVSNDELCELIKVISPDEKINFDELGVSKDSANGNFKESKENGFDNGMKEKLDEDKEFKV